MSWPLGRQTVNTTPSPMHDGPWSMCPPCKGAHCKSGTQNKFQQIDLMLSSGLAYGRTGTLVCGHQDEPVSALPLHFPPLYRGLLAAAIVVPHVDSVWRWCCRRDFVRALPWKTSARIVVCLLAMAGCLPSTGCRRSRQRCSRCPRTGTSTIAAPNAQSGSMSAAGPADQHGTILFDHRLIHAEVLWRTEDLAEAVIATCDERPHFCQLVTSILLVGQRAMQVLA